MSELVNAIKQGNEAAFEQAFLQLRDKVFLYFLKKTGAEEDARDLLQNTFLRLWQYRGSMNEAFSLDQHLFNIAKTVYIDHLRKRQLLVFKGVLPEGQATPAADIAWDVDRRLQRILEKMPPARRQAFVLNKLYGRSYREVAAAMSITVKAVENHVAKAVKELRKHLPAALIFFFWITEGF
ncbi:RNA polymerase sigma factor [Chitinophaga alhagiae]|uniref:RNA polymerase sigma factor n=1 Tax=Chitinophaga alhagiae TaxID=2203219 RepID=UPI0013009825|nr:RNA polymerase sigma factor [Chitinophaga alhagiae]